METSILSANNHLRQFTGSDQPYTSAGIVFYYSEGVRELARKFGMYWFLQLISSYQKNLHKEEFQVWKLERDMKIETIDQIKHVVDRKSSFTVICEDGNNNVIKTHKLNYSDFPLDVCSVWLCNGMLYLPSEH